jgi:hypothetical protein
LRYALRYRLLRASRGHPAADVARTRLIVDAGARPTGSSSVAGRLDPLGGRLEAPVDDHRSGGPVEEIGRLEVPIAERASAREPVEQLERPASEIIGHELRVDDSGANDITHGR